MPFRPRPGDTIELDGITFTFTANPQIPRFAYSQEGRVARVYRIDGAQRSCALKVFKAVHQTESLATAAARLAPYATLAGMRVCQRSAVVPERHGKLLKKHPDLKYAILMPWVYGPTWHDVLTNRRALDREQSLSLARGLAEVLVGLEQRGIAHCDLSAPNVLLPMLDDTTGIGSPIELVDVEQMYGADLPDSDRSMAGSPGYAHLTAANGIWEPAGDRFAGAVVLSEMLAWHSPHVREMAAGDSFFEPSELQRDSQRYRVLRGTLSDSWGEAVAALLDRAWQSRSLPECPAAGEWSDAIKRAASLGAGGVYNWSAALPGSQGGAADPWGRYQMDAGNQPDPRGAGAAQPPISNPWNTAESAPRQPAAWDASARPAESANVANPWSTPERPTPEAAPWGSQPWPAHRAGTQPADFTVPEVGAFGPRSGQDSGIRQRPVAYRTASGTARGASLAVDLVLSTLLCFVVGLALALPLKISYTVPALLIWLAYFTASWTALSATPGQILFGLRVVDAQSSQPLTLWQSTVRSTAYVLSLVSFGAGFFMGLRAPGASSLADWLARTRVVATD